MLSCAHQNGGQIVGLPVLVLAQDQDAIALTHGAITKASHAALGLGVECLSVIAQRVRLAGAAEDDWRGPQLADDDAFFGVGLLVIGVIRQRAEVEVRLQPGAMVFVRVTEQEGVYVGPTQGVARQPFPQVRGNVAGVVVGIVSGDPDVGVDEDGRGVGIGQANEGHVAVADREEGDGGVQRVVYLRRAVAGYRPRNGRGIIPPVNRSVYLICLFTYST